MSVRTRSVGSRSSIEDSFFSFDIVAVISNKLNKFLSSDNVQFACCFAGLTHVAIVSFLNIVLYNVAGKT